ncbi:MAG: hypothetical protein Fur0018_05270 [Anaerolineales bacterium]
MNTNPSQPAPFSTRLWRVLTSLLVALLAGVTALLGYDQYNRAHRTAQIAGSLPEQTVPQGEAIALALPPIQADKPSQRIAPVARLHTDFPTRQRVDVITYTVQTGDNLFSIADQFGIKPETVLWGNYETLNGNFRFINPGQLLRILPIDGAYYQWQEGDDLNTVANFFGVQPEDILKYPGNGIDLITLKEHPEDITFEPGQWLIIPGGRRELVDWGPPAITRSNPAVARYYGPGACGAISQGAVGTYTFIWPTTSRLISGYRFVPGVHPAIDIGGSVGNAIYASDSGVVVYAGWSNYGYGFLIVLDHGNGWQTAYAHLSGVYVHCGQSVYQGDVIGALGSTGNSTGPHLHFEMGYNGVKVNPLDMIP